MRDYPDTPFSIQTSSVENSPGTWNSTLVEVFKDGKKIGGYKRNYPSGAEKTFYPFQKNGKWYALYSSRYDQVRVAFLENDTFEDWCEGSSKFCPVEFYVPRYIFTAWVDSHSVDPTRPYIYVDWDNDEEFNQKSDYPLKENIVEFKDSYADFAFVSGCIWGDDTSWKLRYIDLSQLEDKKITVSERYGYFELPNGKTLKECIQFSDLQTTDKYIRLCEMTHWVDGKRQQY